MIFRSLEDVVVFFKNVVEFMLVSKYDPMNLNQVDTTNLISIYEIYQ